MAAGLRLGYLPQGDQLSRNGRRDRVRRRWRVAHPLGSRPPGARDHGRAAARDRPGRAGRAAVRRRAAAGRARLAAGGRARRAAARRADQPPGHRGDRLARPPPARPRGCAVIVVSHDRWLLDTVCERTWEVDRGQVHSAEGGYSAYVLAQAERERSEEVAERRRRNLARKELAWLQRGARARTTKAKFRVEAANALIAAEPPPRDSVELTRLATARLGKTVIELEDVTVSAGDRALLDQVTWRLGPGDRVGIVGVNGSGKTSLLNVLDGGSAARASGLHAEGTIVRGKTVRLAHLSQELAELDPDQRVREAVEEIRLRIQVGDRELSAGQLLERLGFTAERQWTPDRRPVRRRAAPGPDAPAAHDRTQRAAARRADQRPGHRDAHRARGPARRLARHAGGGQPRPVLPRAGDRARGGAARRRQALLPRRRGGRVPGPGPGRPPRPRAAAGPRRDPPRPGPRPRRSAPRARNCSASSASWTG